MRNYLAIAVCLILSTCATLAPAQDVADGYMLPTSIDEEGASIGVTPPDDFYGDVDNSFSVNATWDKRDGPMTMSLVPITDGTAWAKVVFQNRLTRVVKTPLNYYFVYDGKTVHVELEGGTESEPDTLIVNPPEGYVAIPYVSVVAEDELVEIIIYPALLG